ncbi:HNH endonuclease signature motif containing protein [Mycolicibacterium sediminis]|uniref:DUF222 domain-containing protein n=1 Tax=Mycolicibacterium sediminis TaxID=1286180 RepID=A0A7I7QMV4_9MYCO|nr:HNH endonuclease signature motif containing protein [Mycolicibacterium sediminis]BBY27693.1 hypothetical protein MSEDJ_17890 [Mycolicibacterium sediminis]
MTAARSFLFADAARDRVRADLDAIDAALDRLRETSTDMVGNSFRVELTERLEHHHRVTRGLTYRMFAEMADPPDGAGHLPGGPGVRLRDALATRLRLVPREVTRRFKVAARITPSRSITGAIIAPELPVLAEAVESGAVGEDHITEVCKALDALPPIAAHEKATIEATLVGHARTQDADFVADVGKRIADTINPDGLFDDAHRKRQRGFTIHTQGPDGMSRCSGNLDPETRALVEATVAAVRPGHHVPDAGADVVDGATDTRTGAQRMHDALKLGLRAGIGSGSLGTHRGIPVTVIATTTVADLDQAAHAMTDPDVPMPRPARTGGGSSLPMRDLIRLAANAVHYLAVFDDHSDRPIYLARSKRIATADQRIVCHARDQGCTRPGCTRPGYQCEVHHAPDWSAGGTTDADSLYFACGPDHTLVTRGHATTTVTDDGRLAWSIGGAPPTVNPLQRDADLHPRPSHR